MMQLLISICFPLVLVAESHKGGFLFYNYNQTNLNSQLWSNLSILLLVYNIYMVKINGCPKGIKTLN